MNTFDQRLAGRYHTDELRAEAHRVTVLGSTRNSDATSPGVSSRSRCGGRGAVSSAIAVPPPQDQSPPGG